MRRILFFWIVTVVIANPVFVGAQNFSDRFAKGNTSFGGELGFGHTFNLPPGKDRTDLSFAFIFPNWQKNLTGIIAPDSFFQGALYWHIEASGSSSIDSSGSRVFDRFFSCHGKL